MKLTAYDLAQDKGAILAAMLDKAAPVAAPAPKKIAVRKRAKKSKKDKPAMPAAEPSGERAQAELIELMLADGWFKADIIAELKINEHQYAAHRRWTKYNCLKRVFGSNKAFVVTPDFLSDLRVMTTKQASEKYGLHPDYVTKARRDHGIPSPGRSTAKLKSEHNQYIDSRLSASRVAEITGLSVKQVKYARHKRGWRGGALQ